MVHKNEKINLFCIFKKCLRQLILHYYLIKYYNIIKRSIKYYNIIKVPMKYYNIIKRSVKYYNIIKRSMKYYNIIKRSKYS